MQLQRSVLWVMFWGLSCSISFGQLEAVEEHYEKLEKMAKSSPQTIEYVQQDDGWVEDYSQLSQIVLLRHGEPALDKRGWRKRKEAMQFIRAYDSVGIYPPAFTPLLLRANELNVIHTSNIARSIATAKEVFEAEEKQLPDSTFREFERKIFSFPNIKLPLSWWLTGSRVLWFMGLNKKGIEPFSQAKKRARQGAGILSQEAYAEGKVLLVSHGLLNHYLVKYLKKNGWTEVYDGGKGYLSQKVLVSYKP